MGLNISTHKNIKCLIYKACDHKICYEKAVRNKVFLRLIKEIDRVLTQVNSLIACCDGIISPTIVIDVDEKDPLHWENMQLSLNYSDEMITLKALQGLGYEIYPK